MNPITYSFIQANFKGEKIKICTCSKIRQIEFCWKLLPLKSYWCLSLNMQVLLRYLRSQIYKGIHYPNNQAKQFGVSDSKCKYWSFDVKKLYHVYALEIRICKYCICKEPNPKIPKEVRKLNPAIAAK